MKPVTIESLPDAPVKMWYGSSALIGNKVYFNSYENKTVYEFSDNQWHELPLCPNKYFTIVSVDDILTAVGGWWSVTHRYSNKLYSYINNKWVKYFPPMPTKKMRPAAVYANMYNTLIVAGGWCDSKNSPTVEILNIANTQWSSVSSLSAVPTDQPSSTICGDYVYIHPRTDDDQEKYSVYQCSITQLTLSQPSSAIWEKIAPLPVSHSTLVAFNDNLLAVGGEDSNGDRTKDIYQYNMTPWTVVSQISTPRALCFTVVLPGNKLMVVGGDGTLRKCQISTFV